MTDLSLTVAPKSDQLNADDLIAGPRVITITKVTGQSGDQPISIFFEGDNGKPYKPCKSMRRVMIKAWGKDGSTYPGRSMRLYMDPSVKFGGVAVGGIRIKDMSHIDSPVTLGLTVSKAKRAPYTVGVLAAEKSPTNDVQIQAARQEAREQAKKGTANFTNWWNGEDGKKVRHLLDELKPELKEICTKADAAENDNPFGLDKKDQSSESPTAEEIEAAAQAAINEANQKAAEGQDT